MSGKVGMRSAFPSTLPARFRQGFAWTMDKRSLVAREVASDLVALWQDLGGYEGLSIQERWLCERVVYLRQRVVEYETAIMAGKPLPMDAGTYSNHANVLLGHLRALGLSRRQRPVRALREVMGGSGHA